MSRSTPASGTTIGELADELATGTSASTVDRAHHRRDEPAGAESAGAGGRRRADIGDVSSESSTPTRPSRAPPAPSPVTLSQRATERRFDWPTADPRSAASGTCDVVVPTPGVAPVHAVIDVDRLVDLHARANAAARRRRRTGLGGVRLSSGVARSRSGPSCSRVESSSASGRRHLGVRYGAVARVQSMSRVEPRIPSRFRSRPKRPDHRGSPCCPRRCPC